METTNKTGKNQSEKGRQHSDDRSKEVIEGFIGMYNHKSI